jgi:WD40 repeat protein
LLKERKKGLSMKSPFKFLDAYDRQDKEIFFGRAEEIEQLYRLVFQTNLLLVYGQSGTGKTSLIQCGLANRFKATDWFELFVRRKDNINAALDQEIRKRAETPIAGEAAVPEAIHSLYLDYLKPVYLIFDQFEELFILGSKQEQQSFIRTMATLLESDVACKVIFVMREEYIAMLYDFEKAVPALFNKRFRVEAMSLQNVQQVITGTTAAFGIALEKGETTAQQIIDNLSDRRAGVQLSYLQVYLDKLYRKAANEQNGHALVGRAQEGQARKGQAGTETPIIFTERLVRQTGALGDVMADFLEEQTAAIQKELTAKYHQTPQEAVQLTLEEFATLEGTKQPVPRAELSAKLPMLDPIIDDCLAALERSRILRNVEGVYELAHDTLAGRIDERRSVERKNLLKVQKLIDDRYAAFDQTHTLLNKVELNYIEPYLDKLKLSSETAAFVQKSKSAAKRKQKQLIVGTIGIIAILAVSAIVAFVQMLIAKNLKYYDGNFSQAKQFEEKAGQALQDQEAIALQKSWLYTLAALGQDLDTKKSLPLSQERLIRQGIAAGIYQQLWSSPGTLNEIKHVEFSPDGKRIAIVSVDGVIRFGDMATGAELNSLRHHAESVTDSVTAVAFSHDGKWLASASGDLIKLWDVEQDTLIESAHVDKAEIVRSVAFSPDDKMLASSSTDGAIRLWNLESPGWLGSLLNKPAFFKILKVLPGHGGEVCDLVFSPNGKWLASADGDGTIRVWDVEAGRISSTLAGHQHEVWTVAFSPDGRILASGAKDKTIRLWDLQQHSVLHTLTGHRDEVRKVVFSLDGKVLASASGDRTIRIWDVTSGSAKHSLPGHAGAVRTLAFSPDTTKRLLLSGASDRSIRLWNVDTGKELAANAGHWDKINCVAFSPNDSLLASGSHDGTVLLWNRFTGEQLNRLPGHQGAVWSLAFSPDGKLLISGGEDKTVRVWEARTGVVVDSLAGHARAINCVAMDPGASYIASGSSDKTVRLWQRNADKNDRVKFIAVDEKLERHGSSVRSIVFHPKDSLLVSGDSLGTIIFWDLQTRQKITSWYGHDKAINSLAFNRAGNRLASASDDDQIRIWNIKTLLDSTKSSPGPWRFEPYRTVIYKLTKRSFEKLKSIKVPENVLSKLSIIEDRSFAGELTFLAQLKSLLGDELTNRYQLSLLEDAAKKEAQELLVYGPAPGAPKKLSLDLMVELSGHEDDVLSVAFNDDGRFLASGSGDETIRIWDVKAASELAVFDGHQDDVYGVAFNHDRQRLVLASASWDKSIRLWDVQESSNLDTILSHQAAVRGLAFSPAGRYLVSAAEDHRLRRWKIRKGRAGAMVNRVGGAAILLSVAFTPDESLVAFGSEDDFIRLWNTSSLQFSKLSGHYGDGLSVAISRDGKYLASGSSDGKIRLWDLEAGAQKPFEKVDAHQDKVRSVAFSPKENLLASAGSDKLVRLWELDEREKKLKPWQNKSYDGHKNGVWSVAFSPDGSSLATGSWDNTVHIWNFRTDRARRLSGHRGPVLAVAFSPDGARLASGSWDQTVRLWEVQTGRELDVIRVHTAPVTSVAFDPAGKFLASGAKDQTIRLRNLGYLSSFEFGKKEAVQKLLAEVVGDTSAHLHDLDYLTSDKFTQQNSQYLPFNSLFQAYSYLFAHRLDGSSELVEEPPKFYLKATEATVFEKPHKFQKLRQPRPSNIGALKWVYENIPDSLRITRR